MADAAVAETRPAVVSAAEPISRNLLRVNESLLFSFSIAFTPLCAYTFFPIANQNGVTPARFIRPTHSCFDPVAVVFFRLHTLFHTATWLLQILSTRPECASIATEYSHNHRLAIRRSEPRALILRLWCSTKRHRSRHRVNCLTLRDLRIRDNHQPTFWRCGGIWN